MSGLQNRLNESCRRCVLAPGTQLAPGAERGEGCQAYSYSMSPLVVVMHAHIIPTHDCVSLKHSFKFFCKKFTARSRIILYPQSESYHPQSLSTHAVARASRADFLNGRITISKRRLARASRSARTYVHVYVGNPGQSYYIILTRIIRSYHRTTSATSAI